MFSTQKYTWSPLNNKI